MFCLHWLFKYLDDSFLVSIRKKLLNMSRVLESIGLRSQAALEDVREEKRREERRRKNFNEVFRSHA